MIKIYTFPWLRQKQLLRVVCRAIFEIKIYNGLFYEFKLTDSKTDDRVCLDDLTEDWNGKIVWDKGYIKKALSEPLFARELRVNHSHKEKHES